MVTQLIKKAKEKSDTKIQEAADELAYLTTFNQNITHDKVRTMQDLSDFVFINIVNTTLLRHGSYLEFLRAGVQYDTVSCS